ncbi:MAG: hypothetical protein B7Z55_08945, partial [Planctomycetales bacterium 12-60-4]
DQVDLAVVEVEGPGTPLRMHNDFAPGDRFQILSALPKFGVGGSLTKSSGIFLPAAEHVEHGLASISAEGQFNPGSAIVDGEGRLLAITTSRYLGSAITNQSTAIPSTQIQAWLEGIGRTPQTTDQPSSQTASNGNSVVRLTGQFAPSPLGLREALPEDLRTTRSEYEDQACVHCNGGATIRCTVPGCAFGAVTSYDTFTDVIDTPSNGRIIRKGTTVRRDRCEACDATGRLKCPICDGTGVSPDVQLR